MAVVNRRQNEFESASVFLNTIGNECNSSINANQNNNIRSLSLLHNVLTRRSNNPKAENNLDKFLVRNNYNYKLQY